MDKFWVIFRVQLEGFFATGNKKRRLSGPIAIGLMFLLFFVAFGSCALGFAALMQDHGKVLLVMPLMLLMACIFIIIMTLVKVKDMLVDFSDYDLVMSLPVSRSVIVADRLALLFFTNLIYYLPIVLSAGLACAFFMPTGGRYWAGFLGTTLFGGLLPLVIASMLGVGIAAASSGMRHKKAFIIIMLILVVLGSQLISIGFNVAARDPERFAAFLQSLRRFFYLDWYYRALDGSFSAFLAFAALNLLPAAGFCWLYGKAFSRLHAAQKAGRAAAPAQLVIPPRVSVRRALLRREAALYFSSIAYFINTALGPIMMALGTAALCIFYPRLAADAAMAGLTRVFPSVLPWALVFIVILSRTTDCCISIEGKRFWLLKALPVDFRQIMQGKLLLDLLVIVPACLIFGTVLILFLRPGALNSLFLLAAPIAFALLTGVVGLILNLHMPRFDWTSEQAVVKQSAPVTICILGGMVLAMAGAGLSLIFGLTATAILTAAALIGAGAGYGYLLRRGPDIFEKLH